MNEKLAKKRILEEMKNSIGGQLKILQLTSTDRDLTLSVPITELSNICLDDIISIINNFFEYAPEIISVHKFSCMDTNSTILIQLRK